MSKQTKEILKDLVLIVMSLIALFCGCYAKETGQEGKSIFLIMCSLYLAMWIHAGIIGSLINKKSGNKREQEQ